MRIVNLNRVDLPWRAAAQRPDFQRALNDSLAEDKIIRFLFMKFLTG